MSFRFAGYLPADHPEFVGLVVLDDAHTSKPELNYGGLVAGPIFSRIAEKAARYLDLEPHEEIRKAIPVSESTDEACRRNDRLNQCLASLNTRLSRCESPCGHVETSCSSKLSSPRFQFARSSAHLIAQWKASRMTRGECRGMACSWRCAARKPTATISSARPSKKAHR